MPDSTASFLPTTAPADDLLRAVLEVSLTGINLLRPLYAPGGPELVDFALDYLNPAAQQLTGLPERPGGSLRAQFPATATNGVFAFYQRVFETGEAGRFDLNYQADGFDNYFHVAARRLGDQLVVSFNDTASYPRTAVEEALRESQAREQAARAEAERQQRELQRVFEQAPVAIAVYRGPNYVIELANPTVCRLWGRSQAQIIGKGLFEALPEVAGMGFEELLDEVMATGVPYVAYAMAAQHDRNGQRETVYWDFVYVPMHDAGGRTYGVMVVATEVTTQVLARQQVELLNQELESRVAARTAEAGAALREAEQQREQARLQQALLGQILGQVPAAIATLSGPEHRYTFFNAAYQALAGGRSVLGRSVAETLPEVVEQGFIGLLDQVYATSQPFAGTETLAMLDDPATGQARQHYIDFLYQPVFDGQQRTQGILAFAVDVTDRVRARKQAETLQTAMMAVLKRQSQARQDLYQIFEQTPAAIVLLREPNHRIDYYNPAFEALFPPEEWTGPLQGHTITEVYPRVKLAGLVELLDVVFRIGESQAVIEMPLERLQPGSPRYVTFAYQAYREQGHIVGVAAFVYDVTDQVLARQQVQDLGKQANRIVVLDSEGYPAGLVGLVAAKLVEELARPVLMLERGPETSRGSARSIPNFNIFEALQTCDDLFERYGGHSAAAGFTIATDRLPELEARLLEYAATHMPDEMLTPALEIDADVPLGTLSWALLEQIAVLEPFGQSNPQPVLLSRRVRVISSRAIGAEGQHLKLRLDDGADGPSYDAIAFRLGQLAPHFAKPRVIDIAYTLEANEWNGSRNLQLNIKDLRQPQA